MVNSRPAISTGLPGTFVTSFEETPAPTDTMIASGTYDSPVRNGE